MSASSQDGLGPPRPARSLGLWSATALVIASMIGAGVFTTSGFLLGDLGSPWAVLLVWVGGGVLAALGALSYGALARRFAESGGEYLFLAQTLHPAAGFVAGWISLLVGFSAPLAAVAYGLGEYAKSWLPALAPQSIGALAVLAFALVHGLRVTTGAWLQNWIVAVKVALIAGFVGFAFTRLPSPGEFSVAGAGWSAFGLSLVWVSFAYAGWNAAVYVGGEVINPERNLPRSLLLGTGIVTALYLALNTVFVFSAPVADLAYKVEIGRVAGAALGGPWLSESVSGLVALAMITSISSLIMAGPRVYAQMARDRLLPAWLIPGSGPPRAAIALQSTLALVMLWSATYDALLTYIGFTLSLSAALTVLGLVVVRLREGPGLRVPGWPWVPGLFILVVLGMATASIVRKPVESFYGLATIALGALLYGLNRQEKSRKPAPV